MSNEREKLNVEIWKISNNNCVYFISVSISQIVFANTASIAEDSNKKLTEINSHCLTLYLFFCYWRFTNQRIESIINELLLIVFIFHLRGLSTF